MGDKLKAAYDRIKPALSKAGKIAIIITAMLFGFMVNKLYVNYSARPACEPASTVVREVHVLNATSVAINERNELMIIDRKTGTYEVYDSEIGNTIFTLYANQVYSSKTVRDEH